MGDAPKVTIKTVISHYAWHATCGECRWFAGGERGSEDEARGASTAALYAHYVDEHGIDLVAIGEAY